MKTLKEYRKIQYPWLIVSILSTIFWLFIKNIPFDYILIFLPLVFVITVTPFFGITMVIYNFIKFKILKKKGLIKEAEIIKKEHIKYQVTFLVFISLIIITLYTILN